MNALSIVDILPLLGRDIGTYGWHGHVIYDLPNLVGSGQIELWVRSAVIDVNCSALSNASQEGTVDANTGAYSFSIDPRIEDVQITPSAFYADRHVSAQS